MHIVFRPAHDDGLATQIDNYAANILMHLLAQFAVAQKGTAAPVGKSYTLGFSQVIVP